MRSLRYFIRLMGVFFVRYKEIIIIGILVGVAFFTLVVFISPAIFSRNRERIGITGRYTITNLPNEVVNKIGMGLTTVKEDGSVEPGLAESWSSPDNGKTWIFKLKPDLKWQNGSKLKSKDLKYEFSDAQISFPDDLTVTFTLQNPYSAFPIIVARPIFKEGLLGTGDWIVKKLDMVNDFTKIISLENKKEGKITYKFYPTEENTKLAFELGEIDTIADILIPSPIDSWNNIKVTREVNRGEYVAVFFNVTDRFLGDKTLRQALSYAINKGELGGERAISPISLNSWAFNPLVKHYEYDVKKAKSMIDSLDASFKKELEINLSTPSLLLPQAEKIKKNWEEIGIKVYINVATNTSSDFQAMLAIFDAPDDPDQYTIWHSTQHQSNITHYSDARIDKLLEEGRTVLDTAQRKQIYLNFQRFLLEDAPAAFLYYPVTYTLER